MAIEFRAVSKRFADGTLAVDDFSLTIPAHKTTVLVGSSGCGKTTLLRMINRLVEPTGGVITIDDDPIADRDPVKLRRGIGYVLQNAGLLPHFSVVDNIVRPMLSRYGKLDLSAFIVLVAMLGGVAAFGGFGLLLGPLLVRLALEGWRILHDDPLGTRRPPPHAKRLAA